MVPWLQGDCARSACCPGRPRLRGRWVSYSTTGSLQSGTARHAPDHKQGPALLCLGRGLLWSLLGRRVQALRVSSEKQGAVPTTQDLARRPHPPRCTRISSVYSLSPDADPKQDSKHHFCVFYQLPTIIQRRRSGHLQGRDGSPEDLFVASALTADPAGAGAALLRPESHVPTIPAATCGPFSDRWQ